MNRDVWRQFVAKTRQRRREGSEVRSDRSPRHETPSGLARTNRRGRSFRLFFVRLGRRTRHRARLRRWPPVQHGILLAKDALAAVLRGVLSHISRRERNDFFADHILRWRRTAFR